MTSQLMHIWAALNGTSRISFLILFLGKKDRKLGGGHVGEKYRETWEKRVGGLYDLITL